MTSHYRHRRLFNPVTAFPTLIEPGEIMVNTANRQLALGDADPASPGSVKQLIGVRFFDAKAQYATGDFVVQLGAVYRSKGATGPGAFNPAQWDGYASDAATKAYIDYQDAAIVTAFQDADADIIADYQAADTALTSSVNGKVSKSGDTMGGPLLLPTSAPLDDREAASKKYVDDTVATGGAVPTASQIASVPSGTLSSSNVQSALNELSLEKAPVADPLFTGNARAETKPQDDNSISIATTAFVVGQASQANPKPSGTAAAPGVSLKYARDDHVHPPDPGMAPLDSPVFINNPTAPTPPLGDNDKSVATTEFVQQAVGSALTGFSTGDAKLTFKTVADGGWVMMNDGTIGDPASGATARASTDTQALFITLWTNIPDTYCAVLPGGRGVSAAADFAAHKTLALPKELGRSIAIAGSGASLSGRALGQTLGEEGHTLISGEQASMPVSGSVTVTVSSPNAVTDVIQDNINGQSVNPGDFPGVRVIPVTVTRGALAGSGSGTISGTATGGGQPHNNMQPTSFWNVMIKL